MRASALNLTGASLAAAALLGASSAWGQTVNYRSIGTNVGILYDTGTASVSVGSSTVTFAGGATLPANVGQGDRLVVGGGAATITQEESVTGNGTASPVTMAVIQGGTDQTYVLFVATDANQDVTNVTGGGLTWTERVEQCGASGGTGTRVYTAYGSPGAAFQVQITYNPGTLALAAVLARYSGVDTIEDPTGENINGESGACSGGTDNKNAQLTLTSTTNGSLHAVAVASGKRNVVGTAVGYNAIATATGGTGGGTTKIYAYDKLFDPAATEQFTATINQAVDWSTGGVVLKPTTGGTSSTFYVLSRDSDTQVTVQGTAAVAHTSDSFTFERVYNTLQAWEDDRQGDLVTDDRLEVGVCYNDGAFTDPLTISGSITNGNRYMTLTVAESQRHNGIEDTGAVIDACCFATSKDMGQHLILVEDEFTRIEWLQFARVQIGDYSAIYFSDSPSGSDGTVSNVMAYGSWFSGDMSGVRAMAPNITVRNSFFRDCGHNGISVDTAGASITVENCTIYGCTQGVASGAGTDVTIRNTIAVNAGTADFQLWATISYFGYNMFSTTAGFDPASYQGNNQSPPTDLEDMFVLLGGAYDLHLEPVGHTAVNGGDDLSATFTGDVDAEVRSGLEWDIGADEIPPTPRVMIWQEVDPQ
jgi:hypothetical protein